MNPNSFIKLNRALANWEHRCDAKAGMTLFLILTQTKFTGKEKGIFTTTVKDFCNLTCLSRQKYKNVLNRLVEYEEIEILPRKNHLSPIRLRVIKWDKFQGNSVTFLNKYESQSKKNSLQTESNKERREAAQKRLKNNNNK